MHADLSRVLWKMGFSVRYTWRCQRELMHFAPQIRSVSRMVLRHHQVPGENRSGLLLVGLVAPKTCVTSAYRREFTFTAVLQGKRFVET